MATHPSDCPQYCCSDFANFPNDLLADHPTPDLSNDIHPLFSFAKFPTLSKEGYQMLELTLRLASKMLEDDRTVEYVVTSTDGSIHTDHDVGSKPGREYTFAEIDALEKDENKGLRSTRLLRYPRAAATTQPTAEVWVTTTMRHRSREILLNLVEILDHFAIIEMSGEEGRTDTLPNIPLSPTATQNFPRAHKAKITFAQTTVGAFMKYSDPHDPLALAEQYILARSFVHELAHVLNQAVNGERPEEVYYKDSVIAEAGFDLEVAMFGGVAAMHCLGQYTEHPKEFTGVAVVQEYYPSGRLRRQYAGNGASVGLRGGEQLLDEYCIVERVPWLFMSKMFTEKFWKEDVPRMGSGAIQPGKRAKWVVRLMEVGEDYVLQDGSRATVEGPMILTCSPMDGSLPERVKKVLGGIPRTRRRMGASVQNPFRAKGLLLK